MEIGLIFFVSLELQIFVLVTVLSVTESNIFLRIYTEVKIVRYLMKVTVGILLLLLSSVTVSSVSNTSNWVMKSVSAGKDHTCALDVNGKAYCWGHTGQVGVRDFSGKNFLTPIAVATPNEGNELTFSSISASDTHTCGVTTQGGVYCWGYNQDGKLGNNLTTWSDIPVAVLTPRDGSKSKYTSVSSGGRHTCGLTSDGTAYCWGNNEYGELGNNSTTNSSIPIVIADSTDGNVLRFSDISAGENHTCGLTLTGKAYCWGYKMTSVIADQFQKKPVAAPVLANGTSLSFASISAGNNHTCALTKTGAAYCWGDNYQSKLGISSTISPDVLVAVSAPLNSASLKFLSIDAGNSHNCGVAVGGSAYCWGSNENGVLGNSNSKESGNPVVVTDKGKQTISFLSISAGGRHTCVLSTSYKTYCWGRNDYGQLGNGTAQNSSTPIAVLPPSNTTNPSTQTTTVPSKSKPVFSSFTVGIEHICGLTAKGVAYCWGNNKYGQLGNNSTADSNRPVLVSNPDNGNRLFFSSITAGAYHTCGESQSGKAFCWGASSNGALGNNSESNSSIPVEVISPYANSALTFSNLSAGYGFTCGLITGIAFCWGDNSVGKLGNNSTSNSRIPINVVSKAGSFLGFTEISAGDQHACGIRSSAIWTAYCWGLNKNGALGDGSTIDSSVPVAVVAPKSGSVLKFSRISVGAGLTCALTVKGKAYCWGDNTFGALGNNTKIDSSIPVAVATPKAVLFSSISAGNGHACGLTSSGKAYCWGLNNSGALGNHTRTNSSVPVAVLPQKNESSSSFKSIIAAGFRTCALTLKGAVVCWGD